MSEERHRSAGRVLRVSGPYNPLTALLIDLIALFHMVRGSHYVYVCTGMRQTQEEAFLAGIGNYLRSEILWAAGVDPRLKPAQVCATDLRAIATETIAISRRSYRTRGVTTPSKQAKERKALGMSYQQYRFQVFGREGLDCYACGSTLERHTMGSRNLFVCPRCQ